MAKKMGFNMIGKHVKIEPDRWYYHCDLIGVMVWQDLLSALITADTSDKTIDKKAVGITQGVSSNEQNLVRRTGEMTQFELELRHRVDMHINEAGIVIWVPFINVEGSYTPTRS